MDDRRELEKVVNDKSRKIKIRGKQAIVPLKFDKNGEAVKSFELFKRLTLDDFRFLDAYRDCDWDLLKAASKLNIPKERLPYLERHLEPFKQEDAIQRSKAAIPGDSYIVAKHLDNIEKAVELDDSQRDSLKEVAKIRGLYKNNLQVTVTQNVFNLPKYDPATEAKLKEIADKEAQIIQDAEVVNG